MVPLILVNASLPYPLVLDLAFQAFVLDTVNLQRKGCRIGEHLLILPCDA